MPESVRYVQTVDGVDIAYYASGAGPAFVQMPFFPFGDIGSELQFEEYRLWYAWLTKGHTLVRYDSRGSGLSQRDGVTFSLDGLVCDLEAVVDRLGLETFTLLGLFNTSVAALAYAARHPERVQRLILWRAYSHIDQLMTNSTFRSFRLMRGEDWVTMTETIAHTLLGWTRGDAASRFAAYMRESTSREQALAAYESTRHYDVRGLLPGVTVPTLLLHRDGVIFPGYEVARELASQLPDASLVVLEGSEAEPWLGDRASVIRAIAEFLELPALRSSEPRSETCVIAAFPIAAGAGLPEGGPLLDALRRAGATEASNRDGVLLGFFASPRVAVLAARDLRAELADHVVSAFVLATEADDATTRARAETEAAVQARQVPPGDVGVTGVVRDLVAGKGFRFSPPVGGINLLLP